MKNYTLIIYCLIGASSVSAQEVVSTQGEIQSNANGSIDFTIGEVVMDTGTDGTFNLTQGFHQTSWNFLGLEDYAPNFEASIFPNPTEELLNIKAETFENVTYTLYDSQGKLVLSNTLISKQTSIEVSQLVSGNYVLTLNKESQKLKTFKLIKTN